MIRSVCSPWIGADHFLMAINFVKPEFIATLLLPRGPISLKFQNNRCFMRDIWHWQVIWDSIFSASEVFTTKNKVKLFDFWTHYIPRISQVGGKTLNFSCLKQRLWAFLSASFVFLVPKVFSWNISLFNFPSSSDTIVDKCWKLFAQVEQGPPSTAAAAWLLNSCSEGGGDELFEKWKWNRPATVRCPFQVAHQPPMAQPPIPINPPALLLLFI